MPSDHDPAAHREDPPDTDPDPGPPSGHTIAEARRARAVATGHDYAPHIAARTRIGEWALTVERDGNARRPWLVALRDERGDLVALRRVATDGDARRVAARLESDVREHRIT